MKGTSAESVPGESVGVEDTGVTRITPMEVDLTYVPLISPVGGKSLCESRYPSP